MYRPRLFFLIGAIFCLFLSISIIHQDCKAATIGVLAKRGKQKAIQKWTPLAEYLTKKTGEKFTLLPLAFDEIFSAVALRKIDYILVNPGYYVVLNKTYGVKAIASLKNIRNGKALSKFGGVIFARKDGSIKKLSDIKGKRFMCVKMNSFGGAQMAFKHMIDKGLNPFRDTDLVEGGTHDNVVYAVRDKKVEVGTVRSDTLERMEMEGKITMKSFRVIDKVIDDFPFVHSTNLYPEWPFAALSTASSKINNKVYRALLAIKSSDDVAIKAKIAGWTNPLDYSSVENCLNSVRNAP